jgi:hypothetical protein
MGGYGKQWNSCTTTTSPYQALTEADLSALAHMRNLTSLCCEDIAISEAKAAAAQVRALSVPSSCYLPHHGLCHCQASLIDFVICVMPRRQHWPLATPPSQCCSPASPPSDGCI